MASYRYELEEIDHMTPFDNFMAGIWGVEAGWALCHHAAVTEWM